MPRPFRQLTEIYRDAFGGLPARTWILCLAAFLNRCGSMVLPLLSLYLGAEFGYTVGEAGEMVSCYGLGAIVGNLIGGRLADLLGCLRAQVLTLTLSGLWLFLLAGVGSPTGLAFSVFVLGVFNDAFRPASTTAIASSVGPALRRRALSLSRVMINAGWAIGPTAGGYLAEFFGYGPMFFADGGSSLLAALFLLVFLRGAAAPRDAGEEGKESREPGERPAPTNASSPLRDRHFQWLMLVNFVVIAVFMQYFTTGTRILKEDYGYGESTIFWMLFLNPAFIVLFEMPIVRWLGRRRPLPLVAFGSLMIGAGFLLYLPPWGIPGVLLALATITIGEVLQMAMLGIYVNEYAPPEQRGAYNGAYGMSFSLSLVAAPAVGGWIYDAGGATTLWLCCGATAFLGALGFRLARAPAT